MDISHEYNETWFRYSFVMTMHMRSILKTLLILISASQPSGLFLSEIIERLIRREIIDYGNEM